VRLRIGSTARIAGEICMKEANSNRRVASMRRFARLRTGWTALVLIVLLGGLPSAAIGADYYKSVGGYAIYIGILPAQIVQGHSPEHPEGKMHGGAPTGRHQYHVVVAVFESSSGARLDDVDVTAKVGEPGLAPMEKRLEPMPIAGTMSYGNYFSMRVPGPYRIDVRVVRPGAGKTVEAAFAYTHPR
jgi:hypothetical protein